MRITSVLVAVAASLTLAVTGCGGVNEVEEVPAPEAISAVEQQMSSETGKVTAVDGWVPGCEMKWSCSYGTYYWTYEQCTAECGGAPCYRDYACDGTCLCP